MNTYLTLSEVLELLIETKLQHAQAKLLGLNGWSDALRKRQHSLEMLKAKKEAEQSMRRVER